MRNAMCPQPRSGTRPIELGRAVSLAAEFSLRDLIVYVDAGSALRA
jgi:hypothetical protein